MTELKLSDGTIHEGPLRINGHYNLVPLCEGNLALRQLFCDDWLVSPILEVYMPLRRNKQKLMSCPREIYVKIPEHRRIER